MIDLKLLVNDFEEVVAQLAKRNIDEVFLETLRQIRCELGSENTCAI